MAAHQAPPSLGFSRQEYWSGLPFPSPANESEKWNWSCSVVSDSSWPHGLQPTRLLRPRDFPSKSLEWGAIAFSRSTLCLSVISRNLEKNILPWILVICIFFLLTPELGRHKILFDFQCLETSRIVKEHCYVIYALEYVPTKVLRIC